MKSTMLFILTLVPLLFSNVDSNLVYLSPNVTCQIKTSLYYKLLDCSDRNLTKIPNFRRVPSLGQHDINEITEINLNSNKIRTLDLRRLNIFGKLNKVTLARNKVKRINLKESKRIAQIEFLNLDYNELTEIPDSIRLFTNLKELNIRYNRFKTVRNDTFRGLSLLHTLNIFDERTEGSTNHIITPEIGAFRYMPSLRSLDFLSRELKMDRFPDLTGTNNLRKLYIANIANLNIPKTFCRQQKYLHTIAIWYCGGSDVPKLNECKSLERLDLSENRFNKIGENRISGLQKLDTFSIKQASFHCPIHPDAFNDLPKLKKLDLSHYALTNFLNLKRALSLKELSLENTRLRQIPATLCLNAPALEILHLQNNRFTTLPSLSKCTHLSRLNLNRNRISELTTQFRNLKDLWFVSLKDNWIRYIPESIFSSNPKLEFLHLNHNYIQEIHQNAFANATNLQYLDVSNNLLKSLPSKGLQRLKEVLAFGNKDMIQFPTQQELPHARKLKLDYHYHCCFFLRRVQQIHHRFEITEMQGKSKADYEFQDEDDEDYERDAALVKKYTNQSATPLSSSHDGVDPLLVKFLQELNNHTTIYIKNPEPDQEEKRTILTDFFDGDAYCTPTPNDFYPCEDLMGREWLRICVWVVFLLAIFGNITVLFVNFSNYSKLDIPRFLVLNLAIADLLLGVYLGFLAFVDIKTIGDFRSHALDWQFSGSCKLAGFIAVFSSELSVFTLTAITMERFLTIKNCMYIEKRLTKNQVFLIMGFGWLFCSLVATLPLINIGDIKFNDYTKYSVCLPFETETLASRIYLSCILGLNLLAFTIILYCYVKIYLFIRNSHAWNSGDSLVARRVGILVFTDFLCWFPIALIALSAVFGNPFIKDLWVSKVITIFVFPLNACANPFLYAITKKRFRKDIITATRRLKDKMMNKQEIRKSLLKLPIKGSLTYSTSVRRESSCSFLFSRRHSAKQDSESSKQFTRQTTPCLPPSSFQQSFEEPDDEDYQERLTTV
eukprot:TCONS_00014293-protein